jgi:hypothetical protein
VAATSRVVRVLVRLAAFVYSMDSTGPSPYLPPILVRTTANEANWQEAAATTAASHLCRARCRPGTTTNEAGEEGAIPLLLATMVVSRRFRSKSRANRGRSEEWVGWKEAGAEPDDFATEKAGKVTLDSELRTLRPSIVAPSPQGRFDELHGNKRIRIRKNFQ